MKSPIFTRLIQAMDNCDSEVCNDQAAQLVFLDTFLHCVSASSVHSMAVQQPEKLEKLIEGLYKDYMHRLESIVRFTEEHLKTRPEDISVAFNAKGNNVWALAVQQDKSNKEQQS